MLVFKGNMYLMYPYLCIYIYIYNIYHKYINILGMSSNLNAIPLRIHGTDGIFTYILGFIFSKSNVLVVSKALSLPMIDFGRCIPVDVCGFLTLIING